MSALFVLTDSHKIKRATYYCVGYVLLLIGYLDIAGWVIKSSFLVSLAPDANPMVMNAAICAIACGFSLLSLAQGLSKLAQGLGLFVAVFSGVIATQFILGRSFGVDQLFWNHPVISPLIKPGRMAPNSAASFIIAGCALALMGGRERRPTLLSLASGTILALSLVSFVGYLGSATASLTWGTYHGMAIPTMISLVSLAAIILKEAGRDAGDRGTTLQLGAAAMGVLVSVTAASISSNSHLAEANQMIANGYETQTSIARFVSSMAKLEASTRAFVLVGAPKYLDRIRLHTDEVENETRHLSALLTVQLAVPDRAARLQELVKQKLEFNRRLVRIREETGVDSAAKVLGAEPTEIMSGLTETTAIIEADAAQLLSRRRSETDALEKNTRAVELFGSAIAFLLVLAALQVARRAAKGRRKAEKDLRQANSTLEARVGERTQTLERTNRQLVLLESQFRSALHEAPVPAMLWDEDGHVLLVNRVWCELTGYEDHDLLSVDDWVRRGLGRPAAPDIKKYLDAEFANKTRIYAGEHKIQTKAGGVILWEIHTAIIGHNASGKRLLVSEALDITERRHAETLALETRDNAMFLTDAMPLMVFTAKPNGTVDYLNRFYLESIGCPAGSVPSREDRLRFLHPDDHDITTRAWATSVVTGADIDVEIRHLHGETGVYRWHAVRARAQRDKDGIIKRWVGTATDFHHVKEADQRFRFLADACPQIVWTAKPDGSLDYYNQRWHDYTGMTFEETKDWGWKPVLHPQDLDYCIEKWTKAVATGGDYEVEYRFKRATDGEYRWHLGRAFPQYGHDGKIIAWFGTCTDIHEQKLTSQRLESRVLERTTELSASEERFRNAFDLAGTGMALVAPDGQFLRVNAKMCDLVGYTETELLAKKFKDITHPEDCSGDVVMVKSLLSGEQHTYRREKRYVHAEGHIVWVRLTIALVRDSLGDPVHFIGQIEDVSEQKKLQANLALARDQALESARLKSEFLANMSHEIRTPMNGIIGMSGLLMETPLTDEQREMGRVLQNSAEGLLNILNDILDFSKIEAGKLRIEAAVFNLKELVEETVALMAPRAGTKGLEVICDFDSKVTPVVVGDSGRIRQIFSNFLGNAIKFTERGEVVVRVTSVRQTLARQMFRVSISDTGIGIHPEAQAILFTPFSQADGSNSRKFGGTGLGLAISRQLIDLMSGELGFSSEAGKGSTFWFELDLEKSQPTAAEVLPDMPEGMWALVVDDNVTNRQILLKQLSQVGIYAEPVADGESALVRLRAQAQGGNPFQFVLLDWHMPEMSGLELAKRIRADRAIAQTKLIMLSSSGNMPEGDELTSAGFSALLTKPVREKHLYRTIRDVVGNWSAGGEVDRAVTLRSSKTASHSLGSLRVLVAEDNSSNQLVARMLLAKMGYDVDIAENGERVIECLAKGAYDVVLMDCQMPVVDGYAAARRIRQDEQLNNSKRVPIIALTAYAMASDRLKCIESGMDDYVAKPIRRNELIAAFLRCGIHPEKSQSVAVPAREDAIRVKQEIIDRDLLNELYLMKAPAGEPLLGKLTALFYAEVPSRLIDLNRFAKAHDSKNAARIAHTLGGTCATFGATEMRAAALQVERACRDGAWAEADSLIDAVQDAWIRLEPVLRRIEKEITS